LSSQTTLNAWGQMGVPLWPDGVGGKGRPFNNRDSRALTRGTRRYQRQLTPTGYSGPSRNVGNNGDAHVRSPTTLSYNPNTGERSWDTFPGCDSPGRFQSAVAGSREVPERRAAQEDRRTSFYLKYVLDSGLSITQANDADSKYHHALQATSSRSGSRNGLFVSNLSYTFQHAYNYNPTYYRYHRQEGDVWDPAMDYRQLSVVQSCYGGFTHTARRQGKRNGAADTAGDLPTC